MTRAPGKPATPLAIGALAKMAKKHVEPQGFAQPVAYERCARSGCRHEAARVNPNDERERVCEPCYALELQRWNRWVVAGRLGAQTSLDAMWAFLPKPTFHAPSPWQHICGSYAQGYRRRDRVPGEDDE